MFVGPDAWIKPSLAVIHKLFATAQMQANAEAGEDAYFILRFVFRVLRVSMLLAVWRTVLAAKPELGLAPEAILTYTLSAKIFAEQLSPRTNIEWRLFDGGIALNYLQPMGLVGQFAARMVGRWMLGLVFALSLVLTGAVGVGVIMNPPHSHLPPASASNILTAMQFSACACMRA